MTLGDILKKYREDNSISMDEFSKLSSISKGYISMLENNINPRNDKPIAPTLPTIKKIANGMNMDVDTLLRLMDGEQKVSLQNEPESDVVYGFSNENLYEKEQSPQYPPQLSAIISKAQHLNSKGLNELEKHADLLLLSKEYKKIKSKEGVM